MLRVANYSQKALLEIETDFDLYYEQKKQGSLQLFWDSKEIKKTQKDIAILDKFKTFLFVRWNPGLEQDRVRPVLGVEQGHVAVHPGEEVDAFMTLLKKKLYIF